MKRLKHITSFVLVLSMCFSLFFFPVYAENSTYTVLDANKCYVNFYGWGNNHYTITFTKDVRAVILSNGSSSVGTLYFVSDQDFNVGIVSSNYPPQSCVSAFISTSYVNGYYVYHTTPWQQVDLSTNTYNIPVINSTADDSNAVYYTYGGGAVDPVIPVSWGKPANVMYNTRIAGSGSASENNIDRIVWSPNIDSNANELPITAKVQIRAVPGSYTADSSQNLLQKTYNDFVLDNSKQYTVYDGPAHIGRFEIKWGEVVDHFNFFPYSWVPDIQFIDDYYLKMGWIYQIRLIVPSDEYESDWINIYTATSSGVEPSEVITKSDDLTQELVQNILIVNNLNNTEYVNWTINDTTINNSEYIEPGQGDKPWWAYLLEAIVSLLNPNDETNIVINNTNNENQDLNNKLNEYNQIEDQQITNLDNSLEDITVESTMLSDSKFIASAQWVAQQYNRMTTGTVIGSLIGFSLLFGLALIFIGKIR